MSASLEDSERLVSNEGLAPSLCAACGEEFGCGANVACGESQPGCWCVELKLSDAARKELEARFQGCLCERCLATFASDCPGSGS